MEVTKLREACLQAYKLAEVSPPMGLTEDIPWSDLVQQVGMQLTASLPVSLANQLSHILMQEDPERLAKLGVLVNPERVAPDRKVDPWLVLLDDQPRTVIQTIDIFPSVTYRGGAHTTLQIQNCHVDLFGVATVQANDAFIRAEGVAELQASGASYVHAKNCPSVQVDNGVHLKLIDAYAESTGACYVDVGAGARLLSHQSGGQLSVSTGGVALLESDQVTATGQGVIYNSKDYSREQLELLKERLRVVQPVAHRVDLPLLPLDRLKDLYSSSEFENLHVSYQNDHRRSAVEAIQKAASVSELAAIVLPYADQVLCLVSYDQLLRQFPVQTLADYQLFSAVTPIREMNPNRPVYLFDNLVLDFPVGEQQVFLYDRAMSGAGDHIQVSGYDQSTALLRGAASLSGYGSSSGLFQDKSLGTLFDSCWFVAVGQSSVFAGGQSVGLAGEHAKVYVMDNKARALIMDHAQGQFMGKSQGVAVGPDVWISTDHESEVFCDQLERNCFSSPLSKVYHVQDAAAFDRLKQDCLDRNVDHLQAEKVEKVRRYLIR